MESTREAWFILLSIPFYSILIGTEILLSNWQHRGFYSVRQTIENVLLTLSNAGLDLLMRWLFYISVLMWCYQHRIYHFENVFVYWFLLFILEDLAFYFEHRVDHYCRVFWAVHVTHHSSDEYNLTTGFRSSVFQPVYRFLYFMPIAGLGFHPLDIIFMYSFTQTYGILVHTQYVRHLPAWFETIFVSPSHHRVHHASNTIYLDKNMGMVLIIWDKLFGTFQAELPEEPVVYGLTKPLDHQKGIGHVIFHEWKAIAKDMAQPISFTTRLKYLFYPPGWSHDGRSQTAREMRKELKSHPNETTIKP